MNAPDRSTFTITISASVHGGESIGRLPDGRAAFVPFTLPGEVVKVRAVEEKRGYVRCELLDVFTPSAERVEPLCAHFGECGGCHYQHMSYHAQLAAKRAILQDQLERIGGLSQVPIRPTLPSSQVFNYRNHVQFHLASDGKLGYQKARSNEVLAIQECHLPEPTLNLIWPQLEVEAIPGLERVALRLGAEEDVQLILESSDPQPPEFSVQDLPISAVHLGPAGSLVLAGSQALVFEVLGRSFRVSAGSFFQVNTSMAGVLVEHLLSNLAHFQPLTPQTVFIDAYCGVGFFSAFLAPWVGRLIGVEASPSAADDFVANLDEFDNVELFEAPAEVVFPHLDVHLDVLLVDPPRAGINRQALQGLLSLSPSVIVYVSCDPATLARDARQLVAGGYHLEQLTPFDLFPQTYHIESVSFWTKR